MPLPPATPSELFEVGPPPKLTSELPETTPLMFRLLRQLKVLKLPVPPLTPPLEPKLPVNGSPSPLLNPPTLLRFRTTGTLMPVTTGIAELPPELEINTPGVSTAIEPAPCNVPPFTFKRIGVEITMVPTREF